MPIFYHRVGAFNISGTDYQSVTVKKSLNLAALLATPMLAGVGTDGTGWEEMKLGAGACWQMLT